MTQVHNNVETSEHITPQTWGPPQCILPPLIVGGPELPFIINSLQVYYVPEIPEGLRENLNSIFGWPELLRVWEPQFGLVSPGSAGFGVRVLIL